MNALASLEPKETSKMTCAPGKKCPCRMWVNCNSYVDIKERERRLKRKAEEDERNRELSDYYARFGLTWEITDVNSVVS